MDEKSAKLNRSNMTYVILHFWLFIGHLNIKLLPTKQMEETSSSIQKVKPGG